MRLLTKENRPSFISAENLLDAENLRQKQPDGDRQLVYSTQSTAKI